MRKRQLEEELHQLKKRVQMLEREQMRTQNAELLCPGTPYRYCEVHDLWHLKHVPTVSSSTDEYTVEDTGTIVRGTE